MKGQSAPLLSMGVAFGIALALATVTLDVNGTGTEGVGAALRLTARWSFVLFWMAYAGGALAELLGPVMPAVARRGREFGLAFAAAHLVHLGLVVWLYRISGRPPVPEHILVFFAAGAVWVYLLAALSFGGLTRALGPRVWRWLRFLGMNYILLAFARDFAHATLDGIGRRDYWRSVEYVPFLAMCVAAPCLRGATLAYRRHGRGQVIRNKE